MENDFNGLFDGIQSYLANQAKWAECHEAETLVTKLQAFRAALPDIVREELMKAWHTNNPKTLGEAMDFAVEEICNALLNQANKGARDE